MGFFTSGLSVNEFSLADQMQLQPLAQVMGASVVRTGWQYLPALEPGKVSFGGSPYAPTPTGAALQNLYTEPSIGQVRAYKWHTEVVCVLDTLTGAWNMARRAALDRLRDEAMHVGADAVLGVQLRRSDHDLGKGTIEYVVTGTAMRFPDARRSSSSPTLTDLSLQDYWLLRDASLQAAGLVATTVVVFASPPRSTRMRRVRTRWENQELRELSRAFQTARETVRSRLRDQLADANGEGAVGVEITHSVHREKLALGASLQTSDHHGWHAGRFRLPYRVSGRGDVVRRGWVITMHAAGTAVRRAHSASPPRQVKAALRMGAS